MDKKDEIYVISFFSSFIFSPILSFLPLLSLSYLVIPHRAFVHHRMDRRRFPVHAASRALAVTAPLAPSLSSPTPPLPPPRLGRDCVASSLSVPLRPPRLCLPSCLGRDHDRVASSFSVPLPPCASLAQKKCISRRTYMHEREVE